MIASLPNLLLKAPRNSEIILFFKLTTVVVAVERSAARQSCGGGYVVTGVAKVSALVVGKEITDMPAKVCDAWFIESLRKNAWPEYGNPSMGL